MKKKYLVILNSIAVAKESSLVDAVKMSNNIKLSDEEINYQTVYTNIKARGYYQKIVETYINTWNSPIQMVLTIQEIEL
jgi:hypothetical protein